MNRQPQFTISPIDFGFQTPNPLVIAGPCSAESEQQVMDTAIALSQIGIKILRAGLWKPRTLPGGFEGMGAKALPWLKRVKQELGMTLATEVVKAKHVQQALKAGVEILWIGARSSTNPFVVQEIAEALQEMQADYQPIVLVKNPINPDLNLWIGALERLYQAGVKQIGAIHRGFSSYSENSYRNPPHWQIPFELKRLFPELTLLCDPSHIAGRSDWIEAISHQAMDLNFDGLIIESHCSPSQALSDAKQQVTPKHLAQILSSLQLPLPDTKAEQELFALRAEIDLVDDRIMQLLARRMSLAKSIGQYKHEHNLSILQSERYQLLLQSRSKLAEDLELDPQFVSRLYSLIHEESVRVQSSEKYQSPLSKSEDNE